MPIVPVNDIDIYYEIHGEGYPLILILGMGMNVASFNNPDIIRAFSDHYQVIAFDNRGIGRTTKPDAPFTVEGMADDTLSLMKTLGIEKAHIVGCSLGACVAQVIASRCPDRVKGLVLTGASSRYPLSMRTMVRLMNRIPFMKRQSVKMAEPIFNEPYPPTENSYLNQCIAGVLFDSRDLLSCITAPTLIINMKHDQYVPIRYTNELANGIVGSQLKLIDTDHLFILKEPELMITPALSFLSEVDSMHERKMQ